MPHDHDGCTPESDRLDRKIERILSGKPSSVLDDDTEDLAEFAVLLHDKLSDDLPDPEFRTQLRKNLLHPGPSLLRLPYRRQSRLKSSLAIGSMAAIVLATIATGWFALGDNSHDLDSHTSRTALLSSSPTFSAGSAAIAFATTSIAARNDSQGVPAATVPVLTSDANANIEVTPVAENSDLSVSGGGLGSPQRIQLASLPPVDDQHVEFGALATESPESSAIFEDVTFQLNIELPDLASNATAYQFATPYVDPRMIVRGAAEFLGIEDNFEIGDQKGREIYTLASHDSGATFTWSPQSGAFSCTIPAAHDGASTEDIIAAAIEWLQDFGYPIDPNTVRPVVQTTDTGVRTVHVPLGDVPESIVGHPMNVSLVVNEDGQIVQASGYWLEVTNASTVPLLTAAQAWDALQAGKGYWPNRPDTSGGGTFVVTSLQITNVLTLDDDENLVLQPVISANGYFESAETGEATASTILLQAAAES